MQSHFVGEIKVPWYILGESSAKKKEPEAGSPLSFKDLFKLYQNKRAMNNNIQEFQKNRVRVCGRGGKKEYCHFSVKWVTKKV